MSYFNIFSKATRPDTHTVEGSITRRIVEPAGASSVEEKRGSK